MKFSAVIVDDEPLARRGIRAILESDSEVRVLAECKDGVEAISQIQDLRPDLVFLDIEMPEVDGFDVIASIPPEQLPVVIFVTAYNQYAIDAFRVHAVDYVLKPVDPQRLTETLARAKELLNLKREHEDHDRLLSALEEIKQEQGGLERIAVKSHGRLHVIKSASIDWIEAADDYVTLHVQGQKYLVRKTLSSLERGLDRTRFVRIHRSTIVNINRIAQLKTLQQGDAIAILTDKTELDVSRSYRPKLEQILHG
jgi:two-component system LytT family response regulator